MYRLLAETILVAQHTAGCYSTPSVCTVAIVAAAMMVVPASRIIEWSRRGAAAEHEDGASGALCDETLRVGGRSLSRGLVVTIPSTALRRCCTCV